MSRQAELANKTLKHFDVAAGILRDADGRVLIAERLGGGPFHGMWEFPGGKIHDGEGPADALHRELVEEIGVEIRETSSLMRLHHAYADRTVDIEFFLITAWDNDPRGLEGQQLEWVTPDKLDPDKLLPADLPIIEALKGL